MANSAQFYDDLGPLAAIWAGRDQGMKENTTLVNQQNTLESIAKSQQDRDIASQKLPFELGQLEHQQKMNPLLMEEKQTEVASKKAKFSKDQFDTFFGQFKDILPTLKGTPADVGVLGDLAKKNGIDPSDSRIQRMIATATSGNPKAIEEMMKRIALMNEKSIQERARQADQDTAHMERTRVEQAGATERSRISADATVERARLTAEAKRAAGDKLANIEKQIVALTTIIESPQTPPEQRAQAIRERASLSAYKHSLANAAQQGQLEVIMAIMGQDLPRSVIRDPFAQPTPAPAPAPAPAGARGPTSMPPGFEGQPAQSTQPARRPPPVPGEVRGGYTFKGGDPADKNNWVKN